MLDFGMLARTGQPLQLPGAHDALSARMIEAAGFTAYGIGGSALAATQLALPDVGLQSFGEYRDAVARIMEGSALPVVVDGENGFGDSKAVVRTVRTFERMGVAGVAFEDLDFAVKLGRPPSVCERSEMEGKLRAAVAARRSDTFLIIGRTDAAYAVNPAEAIARAKAYVAAGAEAMIVPGLPDRDAYQQLRDAVTVPIIAVVVPGSPWFALTVQDLVAIGIEAAIYPDAVLSRIVTAIDDGLAAVRSDDCRPPERFSRERYLSHLQLARWTDIDNPTSS